MDLLEMKLAIAAVQYVIQHCMLFKMLWLINNIYYRLHISATLCHAQWPHL